MPAFARKKNEQLGMDAGTASHRLLKDILFDFAVRLGHGTCVRCGESLTRESFSVEHLVPWLDSANPKQLFFDLANISFSHRFCNTSAARRPAKRIFESKEAERAFYRERTKRAMRRWHTPEKRREKYLKTGH